MAIVGNDLESGLRVVAERPVADGPPWRYQGEAFTQSQRFPIVATLDANGAVVVELEPGPPSGLAEKVWLIVRAAWKHARDNGSPPPRRIARWRADR
jgi:hypothetical protein